MRLCEPLGRDSPSVTARTIVSAGKRNQQDTRHAVGILFSFLFHPRVVLNHSWTRVHPAPVLTWISSRTRLNNVRVDHLWRALSNSLRLCLIFHAHLRKNSVENFEDIWSQGKEDHNSRFSPSKKQLDRYYDEFFFISRSRFNESYAKLYTVQM